MVGFSKKAKSKPAATSAGSDVEPEAWNEWNEYLFSCFNAKEKLHNKPKNKFRKQKVVAGVVNFIMDLGFPKAADSQWDTKCALPLEGEEYSDEEVKYLKGNEGKGHDFIWVKEWNKDANNGKGAMEEVRKQTSPAYPAQEYGICIDIPSVLVDWSKHPMSTSEESDIRPYRVSLNGDNMVQIDGKWQKCLSRPIVFEAHWKTGEVKDTNLVRKICKAADLDEQLVESEFDIATAAGAICNFKFTMDLQRGDEKTFLNDSISTPSPIEDIEFDGEIVATASKQIEKAQNAKGLAPFVGILLNDMDYTKEMLDMVGRDKYHFVKRAETSTSWEIKGTSANGDYCFEKGLDYESSDFAKAYKAYLEELSKDSDKKGGSGEGKKEPAKKEPPKKVDTKPEKVETPEPVDMEQELGEDWNDSIPF